MKISAFVYLVFLLLSANNQGYAQNYIGMHKDQIKVKMKESQKQLKLNTSAVNPHYNYLKYEDKINEITVLFFLSDDNKCTLIRKMCDYSNINDVIEELNENYSSQSKNSWFYMDGDKKYSVDLSEEDWFFTVSTRLKK